MPSSLLPPHAPCVRVRPPIPPSLSNHTVSLAHSGHFLCVLSPPAPLFLSGLGLDSPQEETDSSPARSLSPAEGVRSTRACACRLGVCVYLCVCAHVCGSGGKEGWAPYLLIHFISSVDPSPPTLC